VSGNKSKAKTHVFGLPARSRSATGNPQLATRVRVSVSVREKIESKKSMCSPRLPATRSLQLVTRNPSPATRNPRNPVTRNVSPSRLAIEFAKFELSC
jgi:hypothetical protein